MTELFRNIGATRLLITRLDMTRRLGSMLRVAFKSRIPLANFSITSKVTEAPLPLNPVMLAKLVLSIQGSGISIQGEKEQNNKPRKSAS